MSEANGAGKENNHPLTYAGRITLELAQRELARRSYAEYLAYTGGRGWIDTAMSRFIAARTQEFLEKPGYGVMLIEAPPQHGKSACLTQALPAWFLGRNRGSRVIIASYSDVSAERFMRDCRVRVERYGEVLFGDGAGAVATKTELVTAGGGRCISRGIRSGITGNPADLIIIDDPVKNRAQADSEALRRSVWDEWVSSLKTRLSARGKAIVIMTPWHCDDLAARLIRTEPETELIRLPVQAEADDPMGREEGAPLCPELGKDARWLEKFRAGFINDPLGGKRAWEAMFMCRPRTDGDGTVKRSWWRLYAAGDERPAPYRTVISVDAAFKGGEGSDYVAITVWDRTENDFYLLYCLNRRMDFPETLRAIRAVRSLFPAAGAVLIEDKANGSAIISVLQREMFCIPVQPRGGKEARAYAVAPAIESGHVYLPADAPWTDDFIEQWAQFPHGAHDDMVDSTTQALTYMLLGGVSAPHDDGGTDAGAEWLGSGIYGVYGN